MKDQKLIISKIKDLLDDLEQSLGVKASSSKHPSKTKVNLPVPKGALGAINMLIEENFFDTPKEVSLIMKKLEEIGHYHKQPAIAMNLLNLAKRRTLNRFKNKNSKNWEYVIRK